MSTEDDPFMLDHADGLGPFLKDAFVSDWTEIVQNTLDTVYDSPSAVNPELIRQLEIALSAIAPQAKTGPENSGDQDRFHPFKPTTPRGID
jgi:hypothetical protein